MRRRLRLLAATAAVVSCVAVGGSVTAAQPAAAALCIPVILPCPDPTTSPTPSASPSATTPVDGTTDVPAPAPGAGSATGSGAPTPTSSASPSPSPTTKAAKPKAESVAVGLLPKDDSMVFTQPSAQLGVDSLSFTGLKGLALVSVRLADGSRIPALRLRADSITMDGFALTVRAATGPKLVTKADRMQLKGDVSVYLNSITATDANGKSITLGADTPPPADGITPTLVRVTLGLVGNTADQIIYTHTDQQLTG